MFLCQNLGSRSLVSFHRVSFSFKIERKGAYSFSQPSIFSFEGLPHFICHVKMIAPASTTASGSDENLPNKRIFLEDRIFSTHITFLVDLVDELPSSGVPEHSAPRHENLRVFCILPVAVLRHSKLPIRCSNRRLYMCQVLCFVTC